jgi:hypothetical protein
MLNTTIQSIGIISIKKAHVKVTPSIMQNIRNTPSVSPKLIRDETFFENKKRYFGTLILVNIPALARSEPIPLLVDSLKYEKSMFPLKR